MRTPLVLLMLALVAGGAAAELYSWKDAAGKIHYSDTLPPDSAGARKLAVPPPNTYSGGMPEKERPRVAPSEAPRPPQAAAKPSAPSPPDRQALCDKARADLQKLEETPRRMSIAGGRAHPVDSEERVAQEAGLQKSIADNCR